MSEFDNITGFDNQEAPVDGTATPADGKKDMLKEASKEVITKIATDPNYANIRGSRSKDLRVEKILGFAQSGTMQKTTEEVIERAVQEGTLTVIEADSPEVGMVEEKDGVLYGTVKRAKGNVKRKYDEPYMKGKPMTKPDGRPNTYRKLIPQPGNVGYIIANVGDRPIEFMTCVYSQDENGKYVGNEIKKTLAPGEKTQIAKSYFNRIVLAEEFNLCVANGKVIVKTSWLDEPKDLLNKPYFSFDSSVGYDTNSPEVKELIHDVVEVNGEKRYIVKPEYLEYFGFLNNEEEKKQAAKGKGGRTKSSAIKPTLTEVTAHLMRQKLGL